jgi:hypothetical protein
VEIELDSLVDLKLEKLLNGEYVMAEVGLGVFNGLLVLRNDSVLIGVIDRVFVGVLDGIFVGELIGLSETVIILLGEFNGLFETVLELEVDELSEGNTEVVITLLVE